MNLIYIITSLALYLCLVLFVLFSSIESRRSEISNLIDVINFLWKKDIEKKWTI
jgi:hypothetical protein